MRLAQTDLRQTGIVILEDNTMLPLFSENIVEELKEMRICLHTSQVYVCSSTSKPSQASEIYKKTGTLDRYWMDQLRSGFDNSRALKQSSDLCFYS